MGETRALLFTDVVDSTQLSTRHDAVRVAALWAAHDRAARDLLAAHGGREIDKADGFLLLFDSASAAASYAVAYHEALAALEPPLRARAGIHVGDVILTENAPEDVARGAKPLEVDGVAKPIAARVMALALGGQTLLTNEARAGLAGTPGRVVSHGHWRVKGLADPIEIFEIGDDDAPFTPPPDGAKAYRVARQEDIWLPAREIPHSLPAERDAFVGRHDDLVSLARLFENGARLVSVLGIGGTGKTRLVTRFGWTWLGDYPGGVFFCDLSEARSTEGIVRVVATSLGVALTKEDPLVQLGHAIAGRGRCLVILDNVEQVVRDARETAGRWLDRATHAQFLITSRELLGLAGESILSLAPLSRAEAVELFVARATAAKADLVLTEADRADIDEIVKVLDELPLAIELAAARMRILSPKAMRARMGERFKLLTSSGGRRDRQATLRGALDWSWELLAPAEQSALAQLSVFEGGLTLEAAEAVLDLSAHADAPWPVDVVQSLVDKSLLRQLSQERFDLLVSVQAYADEKLTAMGLREEAERRHGSWYAGAARRGAGAELDNLAVAVRRAVTRGDAAVAVAALEGAWDVLERRGPFSAGIAMAESVAAMSLPDPDSLARVEAITGRALHASARYEAAHAHCMRALELHRAAGHAREEGRLLGLLGRMAQEQGRADEARHLLEEALVPLRAAGDRVSEGWVLRARGSVAYFEGHLGEAREHFERALSLHRDLGDQSQVGASLANVGLIHTSEGRFDEARAVFQEALAIHQAVGDRRSEANALGNLGMTFENQGRLEEAYRMNTLALAAQRAVGNRRHEGTILANLGEVTGKLGRHDEALAICEEALAITREVGDRGSEGFTYQVMGSVLAKQGRLALARESLVAGEPLLRGVEDRFELGILLAARARVEHLLGAADAARAALDEAESLASDLQAAPDSAFGMALAGARELLGGGSP